MFDVCDLAFGFAFDGGTSRRLRHLQRQQFRDFFERESELLRLLDKAQPRSRFWGKAPITRRCACRLFELPLTLVIGMVSTPAPPLFPSSPIVNVFIP